MANNHPFLLRGWSRLEDKKLNSYSYSRLKSFFNCKYYYYEHYYAKELPEESHGTSEFGSFVHEILEKYGRGELEPFEMLDYYKEHYYENVVSDFTLQMGVDFSRDMADSYYQKGYEFFFFFNGFDFTFIEVVRNFELPYKNKFLINGKIDVIAKDKDGNLMVIDYKSKGGWKNKAEKEEYRKQLYFYAYAVKQLYGEYPKKMAFYMFRSDKWTWFNFKEYEMQEVMDWAESTVEQIESEIDFYPCTDTLKYEPDPAKHFNFFCANFCGIRHLCKYNESL